MEGCCNIWKDSLQLFLLPQISDIVCEIACGVIMLFVRLEEEQQSITDYSDV